MKKARLFLLMMVFFFADPSRSFAEMDFKKYEGWGFTSEAELKSLPEFCIARFSAYGEDKRLYNKWHNIIGRDFIHFHHFCRGLNMLRKGSSEKDEKKKIRTLQTAVNEMRYTDSHSSRNLHLKWRAFFYNNIGQALMLMGKRQEAQIEFQKAKFISKKIKQ